MIANKLQKFLSGDRGESSTFGVVAVIVLAAALVWLSHAYPKSEGVNTSRADRARPSFEKLFSSVVSKFEQSKRDHDNLEKDDRKELDDLLKKVAP